MTWPRMEKQLLSSSKRERLQNRVEQATLNPKQDTQSQSDGQDCDTSYEKADLDVFIEHNSDMRNVHHGLPFQSLNEVVKFPFSIKRDTD